MYWFVYRAFLDTRGIFWDWDEKTIKWVYDSWQSRKWYNEVKDSFGVIELIRYPKKKIKVKLPLWEWEWEEDEKFYEWVVKTSLESKMSYVLLQLLETYYFGKDWKFYKRNIKSNKISKDEFPVLFAMKEVIDWCFRINPIKIRTNVDRKTGLISYGNWDIGWDVPNVSFTHQGKTHKTNLFGLYGAQFRDAMFPTDIDFEWYKLQKWQREYYLNRWRINVILACRWLGKSYANWYFSWLYLFKEAITIPEKTRDFLIGYMWLSVSANMNVVSYITNMVTKLHDSKWVVKWNKTDQILNLYDGKNTRRIKFVTKWQEGMGLRGLRPNKVVIDEADQLPVEAFNVARATAWVEIDIITTIDSTSRKSWVFDMYKEALRNQREYKSPQELLPELWIKYGLDKVKSRDEFRKLVEDGTMDKIKEDYYNHRHIVGMKYTIYDSEILTEDQKQRMIDDYMLIGEDYCLAELFCEYADNVALFNHEWLVEAEIPKSYDHIATWYDEADEFDNASIVFVWLKSSIAYVLHSETLPKDLKSRWDRINQLCARYSAISSDKKILRAADITRNAVTIERDFVDNVWWLEYPIKYTGGNNARIVRPHWIVGKAHLVSITKDEYFIKNNIIFWPWLDVDWGLIEELWNFKRKSNGKYEAVKGKDDQVNGMMMALFALYKEYIEADISNKTKIWWMTVEERYDRILVERQEQEQHKEYLKNTAKIFSSFR